MTDRPSDVPWPRPPRLGSRRARGDRFLLLTVVAFVVTVAGTRLYLDATGYPKVGSGELHIAHMLWGGILLVVASILPLLFTGRRVLVLCGIGAGIGVGLFIDEVGKFITASNDYFYPPAAAIIYTAILILVAILVRIRRGGRDSEQRATHDAIEGLRDLVDGRLTEADRDGLVDRLRLLAPPGPETRPSLALAAVLASPEATAHLTSASWLDRGGPRSWIQRLLPTPVEKWLIRLGLLVATAIGLLTGIVLIGLASGMDLDLLPSNGPVELPTDQLWYGAFAGIATIVGVGSLVALVLSFAGRARRAMTIAFYATLLGLVVGGLLSVYLGQVGAISNLIVQLGLLGLIVDRRHRLAGSLAAERHPNAASSPTTSRTIG